MMSCLAEVYGNASSIHHFGQMAKQRLEMARRQTAALIGCQPQEIGFVSGGTEADNLALFGVVRHMNRPQKHVVTTAIEHPAVLNACAQLEQEGVAVTYVRVGASGVVDPDDIRHALRPSTVLVSVMHANNELGTVQPVVEIARIAHEATVYFHSDGVQAIGKIPVDVKAIGADLYSMSGHKIYAPKGVGVLYVRKGTRMGSIAFGGHHESERRPGTENVPGAVALGYAAECAARHLDAQAVELATLRDRLGARLLARVSAAGGDGPRDPRPPHTTHIYFRGLEGEARLIPLHPRGLAGS